MNPDKFIRFNIAFKPPKNVIEEVIRISQEIGKNNDSFFILDGIQFNPHITIYAPKYRENDIDQILNNVKEITNKTKRVKFRFNKISESQGYLGIKFDYSPEIKNLHEKIIAKLNPLRENYMEKESFDGSDYNFIFNAEQKENIRKYGYPDAISLYSPHLTIARFKNESIAKIIINNVAWNIYDFTADKIATYKMGENGTCTELIKEFDLIS